MWVQRVMERVEAWWWRLAHPPMNAGQQALQDMELRRRLGTALARLYPSRGQCRHCRMPWPQLVEHTLEYDASASAIRGVFVVCDYCYHHLRRFGLRGTYARYYREQVLFWADQGMEASRASKEQDLIQRALERELHDHWGLYEPLPGVDYEAERAEFTAGGKKHGVRLVPVYDPWFGDGRRCQCGHTYANHFDVAGDFSFQGCSFCQCGDFIALDRVS